MTRKQELFLIELGLQTLIDKVTKRSEEKLKQSEPKPKKRRWSKAQHEKFAKSMAKVWAEKKRNNQ